MISKAVEARREMEICRPREMEGGTVRDRSDEQAGSEEKSCAAIEAKTPSNPVEKLDEDEVEAKAEPKPELSAEQERRERIGRIFMSDMEAIRRECSLDLLRLIPTGEWGMPMTLWVARGGITAGRLKAAHENASGQEGIEKQECSVWSRERKMTIDIVKKPAKVVFVEQSKGAQEACKAMLMAGKFVVWIARGGVEQYARDNSRGVVDFPCHAERMGSWMGKYRERGWGVDTPSGRPLEERLVELAKGKMWPVSIEDAVDAVVMEFLEKRLDQALAQEVGSEHVPSRIDEKTLAQIERCYGFVSNDYPEVRRGDPRSLAETTALTLATREELERLVRRIRKGGHGRGVLLHGLPGTGKTMLAKVVAIESGRKWVAASYANWQSCENLGEHLQAMAASFNEAVAKAPSVMFIDELDSIGTREGDLKNASYKVPVINAMLEWVQEAIAMDVVIIGATNHPEQIDAALVRQGRLGEWIEIAYPGKEQRAQLIGQKLPSVGDAMAWASRMGRASPAKIMELVYEACTRAEERGAKTAEAIDLQGAMEGEVRRNLRGRSARALGFPVALGLCAKAWMIVMAYPQASSAALVVLADTSPGVEDIGRLELEGTFESGSGDLAWARLQVALAPAAARVASARLAGSVEGMRSLADLDQVDRVQAQACLQELSGSGMAGPSGHRGGANWLDVRRGVDELANAAWASALASMDKAMPTLTKAAKELERRGTMSGAELMLELGLASPPPKNGWAH